ncbi:MAG: hypothetical protein DMG08_14285 [Acidobacteria bacterium]|nr:MAG: hypothetical protein DMG08_14285 [Acidobacteriota bacterium]
MEYVTQSPPEFPNPHAEPPRQVFPPVPVTYEKRTAKVEYRVLECRSQEDSKLEERLNELGGEEWWLAAAVPQEKQVLLVFMRPSRR